MTDVTTSLINPDDAVCVSVYCLGWQAAAVQQAAIETVARLNAPKDKSGGYVPPFPANHGPRNAWELPEWAPEDRPAVAWAFGDYAEEQRRALAWIVAAGETGTTGREAMKFGRYPDRFAVPGTMRGLNSRFRMIGRRPIWNGTEEDRDGSQVLIVSDGPPRALFLDVLRTDWPEIAAELGI